MRRTHYSQLLPLTLGLVLLLSIVSCRDAGNDAGRIVDAAIERHGGDLFEDSRIEFVFRGSDFDVVLDGGRFLYERAYRGPSERQVAEGMDNDSIWMTVDGARVPLDDAERTRIEEALNSTVYFGFLPYRLRDPPVLLRHLGGDEIDEEPYHRIEVTFRQEGGGDDWEDRFVHWIHQEELTLDYFAYRYYRNEGGTRFRRAVNRRTVGGLVLQDQENYRSPTPVDDIAEYGRLFDEGALELLSMVELEEVRVERAEEVASR